MAVVGILLLLGAGAYLADVALTNSMSSQLAMFGHPIGNLTNGWVFLIGAAAGFLFAIGLSMVIAGMSRRNRRRRAHQAALAEQRAETERLALELERERAARMGTSGDETAVVYPNETVAPADQQLYRRP